MIVMWLKSFRENYTVLLFLYSNVQFGCFDKEKKITFLFNSLIIFGNFFNNKN